MILVLSSIAMACLAIFYLIKVDLPLFFLCFITSLAALIGYAAEHMNRVISAKHVYWVLRDNAAKGTKFLSRGTMRTIAEPWIHGSGINFRVGKYYLQVGLFRLVEFEREDQGLLEAIQSRYMDTTPSDINKWA